MSDETLQALANAFLAASEQMRERPKRHPMLAHLPEETPNPTADMTRQICADVLKAIGDVYLGQSVQ